MNIHEILSEVDAALVDVERVGTNARLLSRRAPAISRWSVGEHCQHLAQANAQSLGAVLTILGGTDEKLVRAGKTSLAAREILRVGRIPRGRAEAPADTRPARNVAEGERARELHIARERLNVISARAAETDTATRRFPHPALGPLGTRDWLRFTTIHIRHHLAIAYEILESR